MFRKIRIQKIKETGPFPMTPKETRERRRKKEQSESMRVEHNPQREMVWRGTETRTAL